MPVAKTKPAKTDMKARARPDEPGSRLFFSPAGPCWKTDLKPTTQLICFASQRGSHFPLAICEKKKPLKGTTKPSKTFKNQSKPSVPVSPQLLGQVEEPPIQTVQTLPTATEAPRQGLARGFLCNRQEHS